MNMNMYVPYVIEQAGQVERSYDIYSRLLKDRIVFLGTEINDSLANSIVAQLLFLAAENPDKEIFMYINSPGGSTTAGFAILDTMQYVRPPFIPSVRDSPLPSRPFCCLPAHRENVSPCRTAKL